MVAILFKYGNYYSEERKVAEKFFSLKRLRTDCSCQTIIGRYSVLPYYLELEADLKNKGCNLINSFEQHYYIASMDWTKDLKEMTPQTWDNFTFPNAPPGQYVVKGETNSKKNQWDKLMFAPSKIDASKIASQLSHDGLIGEQRIVYRKYVPLKTLEVGINGIPFSNEWRFFFYKNTMLCYGFYWSSSEKRGKIDDKGIEFARQCASIVSKKTNFFVIDIAEKAEGGWICIEVNDGQMSGLSECNPYELYSNLSTCKIGE